MFNLRSGRKARKKLKRRVADGNSDPGRVPNVITEILSRSAKAFGEKVALRIQNTGLTYSELHRQSMSLGSYLRAQGVSEGDRVALLCESRPEWAVAYFGILMCGGVVVAIDTKLRQEEIRNIISHSDARVLLTSSKFGKGVDCPRIIFVGDEEFELAAHQQVGRFEPGTGPDSIAMLVYTSGTTGSSKAVMLTHKNVVSNVLAASAVIPAKQSDRFLSVLPLNHMLEVTGGFLGALHSGATITFLSNISTAAIQKTMKETKTTIMLGVPLMFKIMMKKITSRIEESIQPIPLIFSFNMKMARASRRFRIGRLLLRRIRREFGGHVRHFICGGAPLDEEVEVAFQCMGMPILQGYGLTETSPIVTVNTKRARRIGSAGRPLPGITVRISEDGEIVVSGPNVMHGYYRDPETTRAVLKGSEFFTGDIGRIDSDGFLYITGRKKNVIVTASGKNIYPEEIEHVMAKSPYISEICVVGRKENGGESPFAFVIPDYDYFGRQDIPKDDASVRDAIRNEIKNISLRLPEYKRLSSFTIYKGEFPKTTTRKVKRSELARLAVDWRPATRAPTTIDDFSRKLRHLVAVVCELPEEEISLDSDLAMDLGVDSLLKVEILSAVESELSITIPDEVVYRISSFGELVDLAREFEKERSGEHLTLEEEDETYEFLKERSVLRNLTKKYFSLFLRLICRWYFDLDVRNPERVKDLHSFVITPNHNSLLDVPIVLSSLPRSVAERVFSPAAKDYFFDRHPLRKWFITLVFDTFPFDRRGNFMKALKKCKYTIQQGKSLILFPEGTRSTSGEMQPFKIGLGALAFDIGIPIVPTYIKGIHEAFGKGMLFPKPNKIEVRFGEPIFMEKYEASRTTKKNYEIYKDIIEDVKKDISKLM